MFDCWTSILKSFIAIKYIKPNSADDAVDFTGSRDFDTIVKLCVTFRHIIMILISHLFYSVSTQSSVKPKTKKHVSSITQLDAQNFKQIVHDDVNARVLVEL